MNSILATSQAKVIAFKLGIENFTASPGWLQNFKKRNDITFRKICGESESADPIIESNWQEKVPKLTEQYPSDVYNVDEFALFLNLCPTNSTLLKGKNATEANYQKTD